MHVYDLTKTPAHIALYLLENFHLNFGLLKLASHRSWEICTEKPITKISNAYHDNDENSLRISILPCPGRILAMQSINHCKQTNQSCCVYLKLNSKFINNILFRYIRLKAFKLVWLVKRKVNWWMWCNFMCILDKDLHVHEE